MLLVVVGFFLFCFFLRAVVEEEDGTTQNQNTNSKLYFWYKGQELFSHYRIIYLQFSFLFSRAVTTVKRAPSPVSVNHLCDHKNKSEKFDSVVMLKH